MVEQEPKFAVIAELKDDDNPRYLHDLSFARLMDDVVIPYQSATNFFVDGVPVNAKTLRRIKIIQQAPSFEVKYEDLHSCLLLSISSGRRIPVEEYETRLQALFRRAGDDVTSQVIKAYQEKIGDKLKEYVPNRAELIDGAFQFLSQSLKVLGQAGS